MGKYLIRTALLSLGLSYVAWAGQSSFFDPTTGKIVMATSSQDGAVFLRVLDPGTGAIAPGYQAACGTALGNPVQASSGATELSLAYDSAHAAAYVFYTDTTGTRMVKCTVSAGAPPATPPTNGVCGSSNGGTFTSAPAANLCSAGAPTTVTGSGPWTWSCTGLNGGSTAGCSAAPPATPPTNGVCGSSNGGTFTSAPTANLCNAGAPTTVSGSGPWTWSCTGLNGGSTAGCSANIQTATPPTNGVCGTTVNACTTGTLNDIADSSTNYLWNCTGANGGTTANCSVNIQSSGTPDLGFAMSWGQVSGVSTQSGGNNGQEFSETVTINNTGNAPAGSFKVKVWLSPTPNITQYSALLYTLDVSGLAAGQSLTRTLSPLFFSGMPVHSYYYLITKIDADNQVTESNEASCGFPPGATTGCNTYYGEIFIYR